MSPMPGASAVVESTVADLILRILADVSNFKEEMKVADKVHEDFVEEGTKGFRKYAKEAENALQRVAKAIYRLDVSVGNLASRFNKLGLTMAGIATASFAPFIVAMAKIRHENMRVALLFWRMNEAANRFSNTIAEMILPHAEKFVELVEKLSFWFRDLNPRFKEAAGKLAVFRGYILMAGAAINWLFAAIIRLTWGIGKWVVRLLVLGLVWKGLMLILAPSVLRVIFVFLITQIWKLVYALGFLIGKLLLFPFYLLKHIPLLIKIIVVRIGLLIKVLTVGLVAAIKGALVALAGMAVALGPLNLILMALSAAVVVFVIAWMAGWGKIREYTRDVLIWMVNSLNEFLDSVRSFGIEFQVFTFRLAQFMRHLKGGNLKWAEAWKLANADAEGFRKHLKITTGNIILDLDEFIDNFEGTIEELKKKIKEAAGKIKDWFGGGGKDDDIAAGIRLSLEKLLKSWELTGARMGAIAVEIAQAMQGAFSDFFFDLFMGKIDDVREYFAAFGRAVLRIIANIISQLITALIIQKMIFPAFGLSHAGGVVKHLGGMIKHAGSMVKHVGGLITRAHQGLAVDERVIVAQVGEGVLSRAGMQNIGGEEGLKAINQGEKTGGQGGLIVQLTQVIRAWGPEDVYRERKTLAAAMINELERNGPFRGAIKKYG